MLLVIIYERVDKRGCRRYVVKWRYLGEEKAYYIMGGRPWRQEEVALLVENKHDIPKIAKLLGRGEEACRQKLKRLGIPIKIYQKVHALFFRNPTLICEGSS